MNAMFIDLYYNVRGSLIDRKTRRIRLAASSVIKNSLRQKSLLIDREADVRPGCLFGQQRNSGLHIIQHRAHNKAAVGRLTSAFCPDLAYYNNIVHVRSDYRCINTLIEVPISGYGVGLHIHRPICHVCVFVWVCLCRPMQV